MIEFTVSDDQVTLAFEAGKEIGLFLIPNNRLSNFNGDPSEFYPSRTPPGGDVGQSFSSSSLLADGGEPG